MLHPRAYAMLAFALAATGALPGLVLAMVLGWGTFSAARLSR